MEAGSPGAVVWLTGLPASGKTTVARILESELASRDAVTLMLDSDDLRRVMTPSPSFDEKERDIFYATIGRIAQLGARGGAIVIVAATGPKRAYRDRVRSGVDRFAEVLLIADPEVLEARDPKGLYRAARAGTITTLPGVGVPYEDPLAPELVFDTGRTAAHEIAMAIVRLLQHQDDPITSDPPRVRA